MASKDQVFEYRFNKGIDTAGDPKQVTGLLDIENGTFDEFGSITKRAGLLPLDNSAVSGGKSGIALNEINGSLVDKVIPLESIKGLDSIGGNVAVVGYRSTHSGVPASEDSDTYATYMGSVDMWKNYGPIASYDITTEKLISYNNYSFVDHCYCTDSDGVVYVAIVEFTGAKAYLSVKVVGGAYIKRRTEIVSLTTGASITSRGRIHALSSGTADAKFVVIAPAVTGGVLYVGWFQFHLSTLVLSPHAPGAKQVWSTAADYAGGVPFIGSCKFSHASYGECIAVVYANSAATDIDITGYKASQVEIATASNITGALATTDLLDFDAKYYLSGSNRRIGVAIMRTDTTAAVEVPCVSYHEFSSDIVAVGSIVSASFGLVDNNHAYTYGSVSIESGPYTAGTCIIVASAIPAYEEVRQGTICVATDAGAAPNARNWPHSSITKVYTVTTGVTHAITELDATYPQRNNFALSSKILNYNGKIYAVIHSNIRGHTEHENTTRALAVTNGEMQPTMFLASLSRHTNDFSTYNYYWKPESVILPRQTIYEGVYRGIGAIHEYDTDIIAFLAVKQNAASGRNMAFTPIATRCDMSKSCVQHQSAYVGGVKGYGGSIPSFFDGDYVSEMNFLCAPQVAMESSVDNAASGILQDQIYRYCAIFEVYNATGELERSYTSNDYVCNTAIYNSTAAANQTHTINVTVNMFGDWTKLTSKGLVVKLFRTVGSASITGLNPDEPFYLVGTSSNNTMAANGIIQFTDSMADADILSQEVLYTTGGVLVNGNPPPLKMVVHHCGRLFGVNAFDENEMWYTKVKQPGLVFEWSDLLTMRAEDDYGITGLASMGGRLAILTQQNIYDVYGDGPNSIGEGIFSQPVRISTGIGCNNPKVIKECELGFVFHSEHGIYLLDKGFQVVYVSEPVRDYELSVINAIQVMTSKKQIRFLQDSSTMVWNYERQQWSIYTGCYCGSYGATYGVDGVNCCLSGSDAGLFLESDTVHYDENASGVIPYSLYVLTPWLSVNGLNGEFRLHWLNIIGDAATGIHGLQIKFYRDYDNTEFETRDLEGDTLAMPLRITPAQQRMNALRVGFKDYEVSAVYPLSRVYTLSAITLEFLSKNINRIYSTGGGIDTSTPGR